MQFWRVYPSDDWSAVASRRRALPPGRKVYPSDDWSAATVRRVLGQLACIGTSIVLVYPVRMNLSPVTLRKVVVTDAPNLAILHTDPDVQKGLGGHTGTVRCEQSIRAWTMMMNDDISWYYSVLDISGNFVGVCTIIREEESEGAYHLTICVSPSARGRGYGESAVIEAVKLAKQQPKVNQLSRRLSKMKTQEVGS